MHIASYLGMVQKSEQELARSLERVASHHVAEPDVPATCTKLAEWSLDHVARMKPFTKRYARRRAREPKQLNRAMFHGPRKGGIGLLRDLHDLWLMANEVEICWTLIHQAAQALRDRDLETTSRECAEQAKRQVAWFLTRMKQAAPQALVVAE
jgi:hypothetical protein